MLSGMPRYSNGTALLLLLLMWALISAETRPGTIIKQSKIENNYVMLCLNAYR